MDGVIGGRVPEMLQIASGLMHDARRLDEIRQEASVIVTGLGPVWVGADSDALVRSWHSIGQPAIVASTEQLTAMSTELRQQAADQRATSSAAASAATPNVAPTARSGTPDDAATRTDTSGPVHGWRTQDVAAAEGGVASSLEDMARFIASPPEPDEPAHPTTMVEMLDHYQSMTGEWEQPWFDPEVQDAEAVGSNIDYDSPFYEWFIEQKKEHGFMPPDYPGYEAFTETYHEATGTTLDFSLESDIDFGDDVDNDGVVITVLGFDPTGPGPELDSGIPGMGESFIIDMDVAAGAAAVCSPAAGGGAVVCGGAAAVGGFVLGNILHPTDSGTTNVQCWVLATPVDSSGQVVGQPIVTQAMVGIETSEGEMFELIEAAAEASSSSDTVTMELPDGTTTEVAAADQAMVSVLPVNGDTFVVMERVDDRR